MWAERNDILRRLGPPLWYDEACVPRYDPFEPKLAADIYAGEVALVKIQCQACLKRFKVAFSQCNAAVMFNPNLPALAQQIRADTLHYGDRPDMMTTALVATP